MSTLELKNTALELLQKTEDNYLLKKIVDLLSNSKETDFWNTLSYKEKEIIEKGLKDVKENSLVSYEEVMKEYR